MNSIPAMRNTLVLVRILPREEERINGLIMPDTNSQNYSSAKVIAVGPGTVVEDKVQSETFDLKPGQRVFIESHGSGRSGSGQAVRQFKGINLTVGGESYTMFEQASILAITGQPGEWEDEGNSEEPAETAGTITR